MKNSKSNISVLINGKRKFVDMKLSDTNDTYEVGTLLDGNIVQQKIDAAVSGDSQISQRVAAIESSYLNKGGDTMTGELNLGGFALYYSDLLPAIAMTGGGLTYGSLDFDTQIRSQDGDLLHATPTYTSKVWDAHNLANPIESTTVKNVVVLTELEYEDLQVKDANTEYNII